MRMRYLATGAALLVGLAACSRPSFDRGADAYKAKDYAGAMAQWKPLAESGDARAQSNLGAMYANGLGVKPDPAVAAQWLQKAAAQGNADAEASLGVLYMNGKGVNQDVAAARGWFAKAAAQDQSLAAFNLGVLYDNGQGGPADKAKSAQYYLQAANLGDAEAQLNLGVDFATGDGVAVDKVSAYKWFTLGLHGSSDPGGRAQTASNLARLKSSLTPAEIAQGDQAVAAFKPKAAP